MRQKMNNLTPQNLEQAFKYLDNLNMELPPELAELSDLEWLAVELIFQQLKLEKENSLVH
jgi:hypothetical protein